MEFNKDGLGGGIGKVEECRVIMRLLFGYFAENFTKNIVQRIRIGYTMVR